MSRALHYHWHLAMPLPAMVRKARHWMQLWWSSTCLLVQTQLRRTLPSAACASAPLAKSDAVEAPLPLLTPSLRGRHAGVSTPRPTTDTPY